MIWNILTCIATLASTVAYIVTLLYIRAQLAGLEKDRYLNITSEIFALWQSQEFMEAQLWLLHKMQETTWEAFVNAHRGDRGEVAFHQVGSFYDRVGTLVRMNLINDKEVLSTMGGYAIAVWQKIGPLVLEARSIENSVLFESFEKLLPSCYECYVPSLGADSQVRPFALNQPPTHKTSLFAKSDSQTVPKITPNQLKKRLDRGEALTVLDVRVHVPPEEAQTSLPHAVQLDPHHIATTYTQLPHNRDVVAFCT